LTPLRFVRLVTADQYRAAALGRDRWWLLWRRLTLRWGFFPLQTNIRHRIDLRGQVSARRERALGILHSPIAALPPARTWEAASA
jgi:hypothetical protein